MIGMDITSEHDGETVDGVSEHTLLQAMMDEIGRIAAIGPMKVMEPIGGNRCANGTGGGTIFVPGCCDGGVVAKSIAVEAVGCTGNGSMEYTFVCIRDIAVFVECHWSDWSL